MIFPSITAALLPRLTVLYETDREKFSAEMVKIYRNCYIWGLVGAAILSFLSPWLVRLVFGPEYEDANPIFRIYSWCLVFTLSGSIRGMYLIITKNTAAHLKVCIFCLAMSPVTILLPTQLYGVYGLAFAMPFNYALSSLFTSKILKCLSDDWQIQKKALQLLFKRTSKK
jgi:O-antigen/teichoic acid export membrane protein